MPTACCLIRDQPHYRREAFAAGLAANGFAVVSSPPAGVAPGDALVIWNRYGSNHRLAETYERAGAAVIVAENGYLADKDGEGRLSHYALALGGHNGSGSWPRDLGPARLAALGLSPKPWVVRPQGYVLVCGQRGIGSPTMASPPEWHRKAAERLHAAGCDVRVRPHPESKVDKPSLYTLDEDMKGARAVAVWASSSGLKALIEGIPVLYDAPRWIGERGALSLSQLGALGLTADDEARKMALADAAAGQWTVAEIASGEAFAALLALPRSDD